MIELLIQIIVAIFLIILIFFLTEYTLKFRQERLKLEDYRNEILKEQQRKNEEESIELKQQKHQSKLKEGYKLYKWRGIELWATEDENETQPYKKIKYRETSNRWETFKCVEGTGYFKSFSDLTMYLNSDFIELKYWEIL